MDLILYDCIHNISLNIFAWQVVVISVNTMTHWGYISLTDTQIKVFYRSLRGNSEGAYLTFRSIWYRSKTMCVFDRVCACVRACVRVCGDSTAYPDLCSDIDIIWLLLICIRHHSVGRVFFFQHPQTVCLCAATVSREYFKDVTLLSYLRV